MGNRVVLVVFCLCQQPLAFKIFQNGPEAIVFQWSLLAVPPFHGLSKSFDGGGTGFRIGNRENMHCMTFDFIQLLKTGHKLPEIHGRILSQDQRESTARTEYPLSQRSDADASYGFSHWRQWMATQCNKI